MRHLTGFAQLASEYDAFVIDLWGVIHDGVTPYSGAVDCLQRLERMGKPAVLLSNAPRRAEAAREGMRAMGIDDALTTRIVTSGEVTWAMLRDRTDPFFAALGKRVYFIAPPHERGLLDGLDLGIAASPSQADFVLVAGPDPALSNRDLAPWEHVLATCRAAKLPMICANPDLEVIRGGSRLICAGALAERYVELGGAARMIGKPDVAVYRPAIELLGATGQRVLAIGDALRTDIAGAKSAGLDSCWILGGIHADELGGDPAMVESAARGAGLSPVAALPAFVW